MKDINEREKTVREIDRTRASIRKKHRALKTGKMEDEIALEKHFRPIVEPLKRIVESTERGEDKPLETTGEFVVKKKREREDDKFAMGTTPQAWKKQRTDRLNATSDSPPARPIEPRKLFEREEEEEDVFETTRDDDDDSSSSVRQTLQTLHSQLGSLGRKYVDAFYSDDRNIDKTFGVYFKNDGLMLGDKRFDINMDDSMIIDGVRYVGTPGLYELIFAKFPNDAVYTEDDKQIYKSILLTTNAHRRNHSALNPIMGNRGHKYKEIIAPLVSGVNKKGAGVTKVPSSSFMKLSDNKIDYVHWDDPNELVDRLKLLDASQRAGNNAHDNEIKSIVEELCEAGLIIN